MNELTKNIHKMMIPKAAIIAYKYEDRRNFDTSIIRKSKCSRVSK